jgi:hypothetical protein
MSYETKTETPTLDCISNTINFETTELSEAGKSFMLHNFTNIFWLSRSTKSIILERGKCSADIDSHFSEAYPEAINENLKITNKTNKTFVVRIAYAGEVNWLGSCTKDKKTLIPGQKWSVSRGGCLPIRITATISVNGKETDMKAKSYTSSTGSTYSVYAILPKAGGKYTVTRTGKDWDAKLADGVTAAYDATFDVLSDATKLAENAAKTVSSTTTSLAKSGYNTADKAYVAMSEEVEKQLAAGLEFVEDAGKYAYDWATTEGCKLAIITAISTAIVSMQSSPAQTALMASTWAAYQAGKILLKDAVQSIASVTAAQFMLVPGVAGNVDRKILENCIANSLNTSAKCPNCFGLQGGMWVGIAAAVAPLVAEYACTGAIPKGYSKSVASNSGIISLRDSNEDIVTPLTYTYRVEVDYCHSSLTHEGTSGTITCEFWANGSLVASRTKKPISECSTSDSDADVLNFVAGSNQQITHAIVKSNSGNAFYIDAVNIYKNGKLNKSYGGENGKGWCLSTDAGDAYGAWSGYMGNNKCTSSQKFNFVVAPVYTYKVEIDHCANEVTHEGTTGVVSVQFMLAGKTIAVKGINGISNDCSNSMKSFSITSESGVSHVVVKTNSGNAFYIDEIRLYRNGKLVKEFGKASTKGYCLSTDAGDANGAWKNYIEGPTCTSSRQFMYFDAP